MQFWKSSISVAAAALFGALPFTAHAQFSSGTPYSGTPIAVPAVVPAVNFDKGGEGVAYHDLSSGNLGRLYRTGESVDIYSSADSVVGPYKVQNFQTGEWLTYTINVPADGSYDLGIRSANNLANGASGRFRIEVDGANATGSISVPVTGSWETYQWFGKKGVPLKAGKHVLKIVSEQQWFDVSALSIQASADSGTGSSGGTGSAGTPYSGTPIGAPAVVPAVNFDKGGEGIAYHDLSSGNLGGLYRTGESVDIYSSADSVVGPYKVQNFQTGEWLTYTINVPADGNYDLGIRSANNLANGASGRFRIEVDGANATGSISVPVTGSWDTYQWFGKKGVPLKAGKHVLKVVSEQQWFDVSALSIQASAGTGTGGDGSGDTGSGGTGGGSAGTPYAGTPIALPAVLPAVNFDKGGEGIAYHDLSSGNLGGLYRTGESVDIYASSDSAGGPYKVKNFQTGEWLTYTVNVPADGNYDLGVRSANNLANGASGRFRIEVDGANATGSILVPITGSWETHQWFGKKGVPLKAGKHVLKLVSEQQWFDVSALSIEASGTADTVAPSAPTGLKVSAVSPTGLTLSWSAAKDNVGVTAYRVYRNGALATTVSGTTTSVVMSGLSQGTSYTFAVSAVDAAGNSTSSTLLSASTSAPPLWSAGMEAGNMLEWYRDGGGAEHLGMDGTYEGTGSTPTVAPDGSSSQASRDYSRTGSWAAKLAIPGTGGIRLWRWNEPMQNRELYYSVWYFFPRGYTVGSNGWNNILQYKSRTSDGKNDPFFLMQWKNQGATMYPSLYWWQPSTTEGPLPGQRGQRTWDFPNAPMPVGRWFNIEVRYVCSGDFNGAIQVWQDGVELLKLEGIRTAFPGGDCIWAVTNYGQNISPSPYYLYVDDAVISRTRVGP